MSSFESRELPVRELINSQVTELLLGSLHVVENTSVSFQPDEPAYQHDQGVDFEPADTGGVPDFTAPPGEEICGIRRGRSNKSQLAKTRRSYPEASSERALGEDVRSSFWVQAT